MSATLEQLQTWWPRVHEIPPWGWQNDPYLEGITKEEFEFLRDCDDLPRSLPQEQNSQS